MKKWQNRLWWACIFSIPVDMVMLFLNTYLHNRNLAGYCGLLMIGKVVTCTLLALRK